MRPGVDRAKLAYHVAAFLDREGLSYRDAAVRFPGLNTAMLSRVKRGAVLAEGSLLAVCAAMGVNPLDYLVFVDPRQQNQTVTAIDKCETEGHPYG
jgi:hypothetical protein